MKFMLMMNAPRGNGEWGVAKWAQEDLKAHIRFMKRFSEQLGKSGELVDGCAAGGEIGHHLRGDRCRIGGHAARGDAVIAGEHGDGDAIQPRLLAALPLRQPDREFFETAEAARRLCQILLPLRGDVGESPIAAGQVATEGADVV